MLNYNLKTKYEYDLNHPLNEYPRPSFIRDSFLNLNGKWKYYINDDNTNLNEIVVPFVIESKASEVRKDLKKNDKLVYIKEFSLDKELNNDHIILNFDGVFQVCKVFLNNSFIGENEGGFKRFSFDIKKYAKKDNILKVEVFNKPDLSLGVGKEGKSRGGMWYTKTTGIYKTVWIESYNKNYIKAINIETKNDGSIIGLIESEYEGKFNIRISFLGTTILEDMVNKKFNFKIKLPYLWDIENPNLYDIEVSNEFDSIRSYFAFREFRVFKKKFYLNNKEIFLNGLLDQGYYCDGIYTPVSYEAYKDDILRMKALGFNTLRKHIKVEPEMFYYLCDKYGMLVMQDFPNSGKYNFLVDTVLPTIGLSFLIKKNYIPSKKRMDNFINDGKNIIEFLKGHPSVVYYTIFNEGWGEFSADYVYDLFKKLYPNIIFDSASGWFNQTKSDVLSLHIYFKPLKIKESNKPIIISEYGGYNYRYKDHIFNNDKDYGYHSCESLEKLNDDLIELFKTVKELKKQGLAGAIYTQVSDVEDETNGLLTYDRQIIKVTNEEFIKLNNEISKGE